MKYLYNDLNNSNWEEVKSVLKSKEEELTTNAKALRVIETEDVILDIVLGEDSTHGIAAQKGETSHSLVVVELDGYNDISLFVTKYMEDLDGEMLNLRIKCITNELIKWD